MRVLGALLFSALLTGCAGIDQGITCSLVDWHISCDQNSMTQDPPAHGAKDEKPALPFKESSE